MMKIAVFAIPVFSLPAAYFAAKRADKDSASKISMADKILAKSHLLPGLGVVVLFGISLATWNVALMGPVVSIMATMGGSYVLIKLSYLFYDRVINKQKNKDSAEFKATSKDEKNTHGARLAANEETCRRHRQRSDRFFGGPDRRRSHRRRSHPEDG